MTRPVDDEIRSQIDVEHEGDLIAALCETATHQVTLRAREAAAAGAAYKKQHAVASSPLSARRRPGRRRPTSPARTRTGNAGRPRPCCWRPRRPPELPGAARMATLQEREPQAIGEPVTTAAPDGDAARVVRPA
jgi:hypothetical protein